MSVRKYIWWLLVVLLCVQIYSFSAETAEKSTDTSMEVTKKIVDVMPSTKKLPEAKKQEVAKNMEGDVRTLAHLAMFLALGFLTFGAVRRTFDKYTFVITPSLCLCVALFDEIHQKFVPGRTFQGIDLLTDALGIVCGMAVYFGLAIIINKIKRVRL